ncbi:MAG: hypothetical protein ACSW8A_11285 [Lachnospiraceae bacterium]
MINLIRMDIYRMRKNKAFWICLILAMISAFVQTPFAWLMSWLGSLITEEPFAFENTALLSQIIGKPFPMFNAVLVMLSACSFFYADIANGYIKNIAGQMPKRGYTILSKFYAIIPYNLIFMLAAVICNIAGTMLFQKIAADEAVPDQIGYFILKFLLMQSMCCILLLATAALRSKSLGSVLSVLLGTGILFLAYLGIDSGLIRLFKLENFSISDYMPDQLMQSRSPEPMTAILSALVTTAIFLLLSIHIFDRKDVK